MFVKGLAKKLSKKRNEECYNLLELELEFTIMPLWASQYKTVIKL